MTDETRAGTADTADSAGRYRLDSRIATGGMGEVWRATDTVLGREVAVKLLKTEYADDPVFRSRFETEAKHAAALHHPGVAAVYDVGERDATDGSGHPRPFLVMELVEGQPLSQLISADRDLDPGAVRDLMAQVGDALGAAHRAGIIHRDVKPANLIVTTAGQVKVTDFGIARAADGVGITRTGAVMGTPQYLSPEQAEGRQATSASDVYALGVVTFECLAGRRPFDAESPVATALAHIREPVPPLPDRVPADLAAVVTRALSKNPDERYPDGAAFAAALRDPSVADTDRTVVAAAPVVAPPLDDSRTQVLAATPYEPVGPVTPVGATTVTTTEDDRRSSPWPLVLIVVLLLAIAGGLFALLTSGDGDDDPVVTSTSTPTRTRQPSTPPPTSADPETVFVNEGDFVGQPIDEVEAALSGLGLGVERNAESNDDPSLDGIVTAVNPSGDVAPGELITVTYYEDAPEPEPEPEPEPTTEVPTEEPTEELPTEEVPTEEPTEEPTQTPAPRTGQPADETEPSEGAPTP